METEFYKHLGAILKALREESEIWAGEGEGLRAFCARHGLDLKAVGAIERGEYGRPSTEKGEKDVI